MAEASSPYRPLPVKRSIRLLRLHRGHDSGSVCGSLTTHEFDTAPDYEALSYVWGPPEPSRTIFLNGVRFKVSPNLYSALLQLRPLHLKPRSLDRNRRSNKKWEELTRKFPFLHRNDCQSRAKGSMERVIWTDAICINQNDIHEKGHQVNFMSSIYSRSSRVVIWLGPDENDALDAFPIISLAKDEPSRDRNGRLVDFSDVSYKYPGLSDTSWDSLARFYDKEWYERLWVLQEVVLAPLASVMMGDLLLDWEAIGRVADWLIRSESFNQIYHGVRRNQLMESDILRVFSRMKNAGDIHYTRPNGSTWHLLRSISSFKCALTVDMIFAVLGLMNDIDIMPQYNIDPADVFRALTIQHIEASQNLMILGLIDHDHSSQAVGASSWAPRWPCDRQIWRFNNDNDLNRSVYKASAGLPFTLLPPQDESTLRLWTIPVCHVKTRSSDLQESEPINVVEEKQLYNSILDFVVAQFPPASSYGLGCLTAEGRISAIALVLGAGFSERRTPATQDPAFKDTARDLFSYLRAASMEDVNVNTLNTSIGTETLLDRLHGCKYKRCLLKTVDGHFGIGPKAMEAGDEIVVFAGGMTPFVVRKVLQSANEENNGRQTYRLIGECYVHGLMEGQAVEGWNAGKYEKIIMDLV